MGSTIELSVRTPHQQLVGLPRLQRQRGRQAAAAQGTLLEGQRGPQRLPANQPPIGEQVELQFVDHRVVQVEDPAAVTVAGTQRQCQPHRVALHAQVARVAFGRAEFGQACQGAGGVQRGCRVGQHAHRGPGVHRRVGFLQGQRGRRARVRQRCSGPGHGQQQPQQRARDDRQHGGEQAKSRRRNPLPPGFRPARPVLEHPPSLRVPPGVTYWFTGLFGSSSSAIGSRN